MNPKEKQLKEILCELKVSKTELENFILEMILKKKLFLFSYFNQHAFNIANYDDEYLQLIYNKFTLYIDGFGIYFTLKYLFKRNPDLFNATDLNQELINLFEGNKIRYFFLGGKFEIKHIQQKMCNKNYFCGYFSGFNISYDELYKEIGNAKPDVIMIGMSIPLQEIFARELSKRFDNTVYICVGNFFEFFFGNINRAPKLVHDSGFEWMFRLFSEPRRLWKRYIFGIPLFIFRVIKYKVSLRNSL